MPLSVRHYYTNKTQTPFFSVRQLCNIYNFPSPTNNSVTVGVLSFGGGIYGNIDSNGLLTNSDVHKYWKTQNSQIPKVIVKFFAGATNDLNDLGSTTENILDVSVVGAACPSSKLTILLFVFPNTYSITSAFQTLLNGTSVNGIQYTPSILSLSWGMPELFLLENGIDVYGELEGVNTVLKKATEKGINICVAAGDYGATDGNGTPALSVDFPSSCPYLTSVGGTTLTCPSGTYDTTTKEVVWNDGIRNGTFYATGGGISNYFNKPSYQSTNKYRCVPDIALNADPDTGISLYINGQFQTGIGGTSMSAPLLAGYLACLNVKTFINPILYKNPTCFHDIIVGTNSVNSTLYSATVGYDYCSGLGSIHGTKLNSILGIPISAITLTSTPTNVKNKIQYTAVIQPTNATQHQLVWSSSNTQVATITNGLVTALKSGTTIITCTSKSIKASVQLKIQLFSKKIFMFPSFQRSIVFK